jgi:hypothetical protein
MMAPKGLETVRQKFEVDIDDYVAGMKEMIDWNELYIDSINSVKEQIRGINDALGDLDDKEIKITVDASQALAEIAAVRAALGTLGDKTIHITAVSDALDDLGDSAAGAAAAVRDIGGDGVNDKFEYDLGNLAEQIRALEEAAKGTGDAGAAAADKQSTSVKNLTGDIDKATLAAQRFENANTSAMQSFDEMLNTQKMRFLDRADWLSKINREMQATLEEAMAGDIIASRFQSSLDESRFNAALSDMFGPVGGRAPGGSQLGEDVAAQISAGIQRGIQASPYGNLPPAQYGEAGLSMMRPTVPEAGAAAVPQSPISSGRTARVPEHGPLLPLMRDLPAAGFTSRDREDTLHSRRAVMLVLTGISLVTRRRAKEGTRATSFQDCLPLSEVSLVPRQAAPRAAAWASAAAGSAVSSPAAAGAGISSQARRQRRSLTSRLTSGGCTPIFTGGSCSPTSCSRPSAPRLSPWAVRRWSGSKAGSSCITGGRR